MHTFIYKSGLCNVLDIKYFKVPTVGDWLTNHVLGHDTALKPRYGSTFNTEDKCRPGRLTPSNSGTSHRKEASDLLLPREPEN